MARKGERQRIDRCIYRDDRGHEIDVMVKGERVTRRFPMGTTITELRRERDAMRTGLGNEAERRGDGRAKPGTLKADADLFINAISGTIEDPDWMRTCIYRWVDALGGPNMPRRKVTKTKVGEVMTRWATEVQPHLGRAYSKETRRKHLRFLRQWFSYLDGKHAPNVGRENPMPSKERPVERAIPMDHAVRILNAMPPSISRARLRLMLTLGITQIEIERLHRTDINTKRGTIKISARRKAGGSDERTLPYGVMPEAVAAIEEFMAYDTFGVDFSRGSLRESFISGVNNAGLASCGYTRPYDFRHTCGTEMYRASNNIRAVQKWLGHANVETTMRYILGADDDTLVVAAAALSARRTTTMVDTTTAQHPEAAAA